MRNQLHRARSLYTAGGHGSFTDSFGLEFINQFATQLVDDPLITGGAAGCVVAGEMRSAGTHAALDAFPVTNHEEHQDGVSPPKKPTTAKRVQLVDGRASSPTRRVRAASPTLNELYPAAEHHRSATL